MTPYLLHAVPVVGALVLFAAALVFPGRTAFTPDHATELGIAYMKLEQPGAEATLRRALRAAPEQPRANLALGAWLTSKGRLDEALPLLERAADVAGAKDLEPRLQLAVLHQLAGRQDAARTTLLGLRERFPADGRACFNLAMLAIKGDQKAEAATYLAEALDRGLPNQQQLLDARQTLKGLKAELAGAKGRQEK
jgi:Flp pilus assembly protein TadD